MTSHKVKKIKLKFQKFQNEKMHVESFEYFLRWVSLEHKIVDRDLLSEYKSLRANPAVVHGKITLTMNIPVFGGVNIPYPTEDGTFVIGGNRYAFNNTCVFYSNLPLMFSSTSVVMYMSSSVSLVATRNDKQIINLRLIKCDIQVDSITKDLGHKKNDILRVNIISAIAALLDMNMEDVRMEIVRRLNLENDTRRSYIAYLCAVAPGHSLPSIAVVLRTHGGSDMVYHILSILMKFLDGIQDRDSDLSIRRVISYGEFLVGQMKLIKKLKDDEQKKESGISQNKKESGSVVIPQNIIDTRIRKNTNLCTKANDIDKIKFPKYEKTLDYSTFGIICPIDKSGSYRVLSEYASILLPLEQDILSCKSILESKLPKSSDIYKDHVMMFFNGCYICNIPDRFSVEYLSNIVTLRTSSNRIDLFFTVGVPRRRIISGKTRQEIDVTISYFLGRNVSLDSEDGYLYDKVEFLCSKSVNKYIPDILSQPAIRSSYLIKQIMQMAGVSDDFKFKEMDRKFGERFTVAFLPTKDSQEDSIVINTAISSRMTTVKYKTYKADNFGSWPENEYREVEALVVGAKLGYGDALFVNKENRNIILQEYEAEVVSVELEGDNIMIVVAHENVPSNGDKIASLESSQKHTIVCRNQSDMPYYIDEKTNQRTCPDFIFNPNGLITRKTTVPFLRNLSYVDMYHPKYNGTVRTALASVAYNPLHHFAITKMKSIVYQNEPLSLVSNNGRGANLGCQEFTVLRMIGIPELLDFFAFQKTDQYYGCFCNTCHLWSKSNANDMCCCICGSGEIIKKMNVPVYFINLMNLFYSTGFVVEVKLNG
jgi:hypothetical protein